MNKLNEWKVGSEFTIAEVDAFPKEIYQSQIQTHLMGKYQVFPWKEQLTDVELDKVNTLKDNSKNKYELRLALLKGDELIGSTYGWQSTFDYSTFFMGASLILPKYRRTGLYTELLKKVVQVTKNLGYQSIWSTHIMTNNPIIIAKLKFGFCMNGFESNVNYGNLVKLTYHINDLRNRVTKYRAGAVGDSEVHNLLLSNN